MRSQFFSMDMALWPSRRGAKWLLMIERTGPLIGAKPTPQAPSSAVTTQAARSQGSLQFLLGNSFS